MADLLRFIVALAAQDDLRDRFRRDPRAVLVGSVDDASELTGEDVEAAAAWARAHLRDADDPQAELLRAVSPVRPLGTETPGDAAVRILEELCAALDGAVAPIADLAVVEPLPPAPGPIAAGGGEPVPDAPPALQGRRLWAVDGGGTSPLDPEHPVHGRPVLHAVPEPPAALRYAPLDVVRLPRGLPAAGVEPGALAVIVAVHDDRPDRYEVEVSDADGGRRFIGFVGLDELAPLRG